MAIKLYQLDYDGSLQDASKTGFSTYHNIVTYQTKHNTIYLKADDNKKYTLIELSLKGKEYFLQYTINATQAYLDLTNVSGIAPGTILKVDSEQILVESVNYSTKRLTVTRGYHSTTSTPHNSSVKATVMTDYTQLYAIDSEGNKIITASGIRNSNIDPIVLLEDIDEIQTQFLISDAFDCAVGSEFTDGIENFIIQEKEEQGNNYLVTVERKNSIAHLKGEVFSLYAIQDDLYHKCYYSTSPIRGSAVGNRNDIQLVLDYDCEEQSYSSSFDLSTITRVAVIGTIGDSITAGHAAFRAEDHKGTYCNNGISYDNDNTSEDVTSQYQYWLSYRLGKNYNVYNYGTGEEVGYQVKNRFVKEILSLHPDYTIIQCGTNDLSLFNGATVVSGIDPSATMDEWIFTESPIVLEKNGAKMTYYGLVPAVKDMIITALNNGVVPVIGNLLPRNGLSADMRKAFDAYNNWLQQYVASLDNVYMVDFFNAQENGEYLREDPTNPTNYRMNDKYSSGAELNEDGSVKKSGDGIHLNSNGYRIMGYCLNIDILFDASVEGFNLYLKPDASTEPLDGKLDVVSNKIIYSMPFNLVQLNKEKVATRYLYNKGSHTELCYLCPAVGNDLDIKFVQNDQELDKLLATLAPGEFLEIKIKVLAKSNSSKGQIIVVGRPVEIL